MKYIRASLLILLVSLAMSCASRPAPVVQTISPIQQPPERQEEPTEPFERAVWNVKMDTPLVKKYFDPNAADLSGVGAPAGDIVVKGELLFDGNRFHVIYDLASASRISESLFRINFSIMDLTNDDVHASHNVHYDEFLWHPGENEAGLLLSLDDDYWHTWVNYFDMFDAFGAKITFFVQGSLTASSLEPDVKSIGLEDFCIEALRRGHDLGFHSVNHYDLTKISRDTFDRETFEAADAFFKAGIPLSAFAFPFGFSQPWMRETLASVFPATRGYGTNIRFYNTETVNNGYIISKAIDNIVYPDESKFESDIRLLLLAAKFTNTSIVPFTTHDISDNAQWGIRPDRLEFLLKTTQELKLKFYTYSAIQRLFPLR